MTKKSRHLSKKIDILKLYLKEYSKSFTGREIARELGINHQSALNYLNELIDEKIIRFTIQGKNKKYVLCLESLICRLYLQSAESDAAINLLDNFELKKIIETILPYAESIIVFGSFVNQKQKSDSDLDLVGINVVNQENLKKKLRIFPRQVNIEFVTWNEFRNSYLKKSSLSIEIKHNHIIYGYIYKIVDLYSN